MSEDIDEPITATVIEIMNKRDLIIDAGPDDGVELGMQFAIIGEQIIKSPRTGADLKYEYAKVIVKVARFLDGNHSVGRTFQVIKGRPATPGLTDLGSISSMISGAPAIPDRVETIDAGRTGDSRSSSTKRRVHQGDIARQTWGDEFT